MENNCPKCGAKQTEIGYWLGPILSHETGSPECLRNQLAAANSEVDRLRKENAELQARYATLANEASNASLHNAFE